MFCKHSFIYVLLSGFYEIYFYMDDEFQRNFWHENVMNFIKIKANVAIA